MGRGNKPWQLAALGAVGEGFCSPDEAEPLTEFR